MKSILILSLLILSWTSLIAQSINLPVYQQGQYENDTIYTYYGSLPFTGLGSVSFGGTLASGFVTGVDFKIVIDSINQGASPTHAAFADSSGILVPIYQGDTLEIPASFQLFAGDIGFHIIIEGAPLITAESYLCDLGYTFTTGSDWGMLILENTQDTCLVDQLQGLHESIESRTIKVYPNPFNQNTTIEFNNYSNEAYNFILYDLAGKEVRKINNIKSNKIKIEKEDLRIGTYFFQLQNKERIIAAGKLMLE